MNKKTKFSLFLIGIFFLSCNSEKKPMNPISNMDTDFPISEKLEFTPFNKYDILTEGYYMIDDSVLWYFLDTDAHCIGYCYDLNTAEKLSTIAMKGHAANEFSHIYFYYFKMMGDSIQLYNQPKILKTFAKKDIIENKPMNERKFSVTTAPDSINEGRTIKLPNGSILVTIKSTGGINPPPEEYNINNKSIAIISNNEVKGYETINYDSFNLKLSASELKYNEPKYMIKNAYAYGNIEIKDNDMVAMSLAYQFILYTFDLNSGKVVKEKKYTNMQSSGVAHMTTNEMDMIMGFMKSNDKYIFCPVSGYFSKEDKELKLRTRKLFVFDWDLNPIKKFDLPTIEDGFYIISEDCSAIYSGIFSEKDGLTLTKADLKI